MVYGAAGDVRSCMHLMTNTLNVLVSMHYNSRCILGNFLSSNGWYNAHHLG